MKIPSHLAPFGRGCDWRHNHRIYFGADGISAALSKKKGRNRKPDGEGRGIGPHFCFKRSTRRRRLDF